MLWKVIRPHFWILDHRIRKTDPKMIIAFLLLLFISGPRIYDRLVNEYLPTLNSEFLALALARVLPISLFVVLLFAMVGFSDTLYQLFQSPDVELLMAAPVPLPTLFLVKLFLCSRAASIPALGFGIFLVGSGLARSAHPSYFLLISLLMLTFTTLAGALTMMLAILLARWLPVRKTRSWMPVVVTLLTIILFLGQTPAILWLTNQTNLTTFLAEAIFEPKKLSLLVAGVGTLATLITFIALRIFTAFYHEGWNRYSNVINHQTAATRNQQKVQIGRLTTLLPLSQRIILGKEWLEFKRNPRSLLNLAQPLVLVGASILLFAGSKDSAVIRPFIFYTMLLFLTMFLTTQPIGLSLMALAQEGRNIDLLRAAPISMSRVLKAKLWATWIPAALSWVVVLTVGGLLLRFPIWQITFLVAIALIGLAGASIATLAISGLKVNFAIEELGQRTPTWTNYLIMGLNATFALLVVATNLWLMVHLYPDNPAVLGIQSLANFPIIKWLFSDSPSTPLTLLGIMAVFMFGIKHLWNSAVHRLESWEESYA